MERTYKNGWDRQRTDLWWWALYRADESLVADKLIWCRVYKNGWYKLATERGSALCREDETLVCR